LGVFVPSAGATLSQADVFFAGALVTRGHAKFDYAFSPLDKKAFLQRKEELVTTQFMKLLLAGTITGVV
jgi:hypothetical protein